MSEAKQDGKGDGEAGTILEVDTGGVPLESADPEVMALLKQLADENGYELVQRPIKACEVCGFFECICEMRKLHRSDCLYLQAMEMWIATECEQHGREDCSDCYHCTCGAVPGASDQP